MSGAASDFLLAISEPTRLRIVNGLAAAPLFVSDLQVILELPQPTVSRHLTVLRHAGIVRDTPVGQFVLYRLHRMVRYERLLNAVLDGLLQEEPMRNERQRALAQARLRDRGRATEHRTEGPGHKSSGTGHES